MAASSSVLGCLKAGAPADRFVALFFLAAPLAENSRDARGDAFIFFMSLRINSRAALSADAVILRSSARPCFLFMREDLLRTVRRFTGIALLLSLKIDQRNSPRHRFCYRWCNRDARAASNGGLPGLSLSVRACSTSQSRRAEYFPNRGCNLNRLSRARSGGVNQIWFFHWRAFDLHLMAGPSISTK